MTGTRPDNGDAARPGKQAKINHVHQPRGVFSLNTANTFVSTQAEYDRIYAASMQSLEPPTLFDTIPDFDTMQMVGVSRMQTQTGGAPAMTNKRKHTALFEQSVPYDWAQESQYQVDLPQTRLDTAVVDNTWLDEFEKVYPDLATPLGTDKDDDCQTRRVDLELDNPFAEHALTRYPTLKACAMQNKPKGQVNGYLKFSFNIKDPNKNAFSLPPEVAGGFGQTTFGYHHKSVPEHLVGNGKKILALPKNFGSHKLDDMDWHFFRFYLTAFCRGRTLLKGTNLWLRDIAPIAAQKSCTKHALLALAAGYWLHFAPNQEVIERANMHYYEATRLLTEELRNPDMHQVSKEDGMIATMLLLFIDDAVNFEFRRGKEKEARWHEAARTARWVLQNSDPGQRYWEKRNVQCTSARTANANFVAFVEILAQPVTPLSNDSVNQLHPWLLQGTEREARKIHGGTGLCPKLLHTFAQITALCAEMAKNPTSSILPHGADAYLELLNNFQQTSELSDGHFSTESLLRESANALNRRGHVTTKTLVTELTAECWVATAKIYLHCRFFRKPRSHPDVRYHLNTLLRCVERMPCYGSLFTSQSPFFCIFILCMVSQVDADRQVGRNWYETVTKDASNRSSVPPIWAAVQRTWEWFDTEFEDEEFDEAVPVGERRAWWEIMVARLVDTEGQIPLY